MVPQRRPGPNPRKLCIVTLHDKRDCADLIKVLYIYIYIYIYIYREREREREREALSQALSEWAHSNQWALKSRKLSPAGVGEMQQREKWERFKVWKELNPPTAEGGHMENMRRNTGILKEWRLTPGWHTDRKRDLSLTSAWDWILPAVTRMSLDVHAPPSP